MLEHNPELWYAYVTNTQLCLSTTPTASAVPQFLPDREGGEWWSFYTCSAQDVADVSAGLLRRFSFRPGLFASTSAHFRDTNACGEGERCQSDASILPLGILCWCLRHAGTRKKPVDGLAAIWSFTCLFQLLILLPKAKCRSFLKTVTHRFSG